MISNQDYTKKETEYVNNYKKELEDGTILDFKTDEMLKEEFMMLYLKNNNIIGSKISFNISNNENYNNDKFINEEQKAKDLLLKKLKGKNIQDLEYKEKQKIYAYLARRGFSYDSINKAFNYLLEDFNYEW